MKILSAEYSEAIAKYEEMMEDDRLPYDIITTNQMPQHLVLTKGLTQVTMGHAAGDLQRRPSAGLPCAITTKIVGVPASRPTPPPLWTNSARTERASS